MIVFVVDRERFRLEIYDSSVPTRLERFPVAVGRVGHRTPRAVYKVGKKDRTPDWLAPNAEWVPPELRGQILPFEDPHNPFAGGFISLDGPPGDLYVGIGIHGTKFDPEVGTRASHGCIRVRVEDLETIWQYADPGTPVVVL